MRMNLLGKSAVCLLAGAFLAGSVFAAGTTTTQKKTTTPAKTTTKKSSPFDEKSGTEKKKDKITQIPPSGWNGAITITADPAGNPSAASFSNDLDKKLYNIQIDEPAKTKLAGIKTGKRVQIKGSVVTKSDGTTTLKVTDCMALPEAPAATPPAAP